MSGRSQFNCVGEGCEPRIPLFPLRYSVHPRGGSGLTTYIAAKLPLERGFTALPHAQYDLRCIAEGFIYLIDETKGDFFVWRAESEQGRFIELLSKTRTLDGALDNYKEGNRVLHLWARQGSRVHLLLTDTLLTGAKLRDLQLNKDNIRDKLATTIDIAAWTEDTPARNTFPAARIGELVEDYRGTDLGFSPWRVKQPAADLSQIMRAVAPQAQIAVALYDHIALVQDLSAIFHQSRQWLASYVTAPDRSGSGEDLQRFRKSIIADLIERIYEACYAEEKELTGKSAAELNKAIQKDVQRLEQRHRRAEAYAEAERLRYPYDPYNIGPVVKPLPSDPAARRAMVLAEAADRYSRHVDEAGRQAFLQAFADEVDRRRGDVIDRKNDRCLWLQNYDKSEAPTDFGCAFLRYDTDDPVSSTSHALAFVSCIEGMIWGTAEPPPGKTDRERELFDKWWQMPWQSNPILTNMDYDKGFGEALWDKKADVAVDVAGKTLGLYLRFAAIHLLMEQVGVYTLYRTPLRGSGRAWHGAARDAVANRIHELAGTGTLEDARRLVEMLENRYQDRIVLRTLTPQEAATFLEQGLPEGALARGSIARGMGDSMEVLVWERATPLTRYANPFLQVFERGVAGGVAILSFWNLKSAVESFRFTGPDSNSVAAISNLAAAVMGTGLAINGVLVATRPLIPAIYTRASISGSAMRWLAGQSAVRWFGYGGAAFDAITNWTKAWGQYQQGNTKAASYYALAGLGLGLGGTALTVAGAAALGGAGLTSAVSVAGGLLVIPMWGWIVAGVILLGAGIWWLLKGDEALYSELEFWLNDGSFGKHKLMGRSEAERISYASLDEENKGYVKACYAPQKAEDDWKVLGYEAEPHIPDDTGMMLTYSPRLIVRIVYPLAGQVEALQQRYIPRLLPDERALPAADICIEEDVREALPSGGSLRTYIITGLKGSRKFEFSLTAAYTPESLGERLEKHFVFTDADAPWYY